MKRLRRVDLVLVLVPTLVAAASTRVEPTRWTAEQIDILSSISLERLPPPKPDPSNRFEGNPAAIELGRQLFFDRRLSSNGQVSCASCHDPAKGFQDGLPVGHGVGTGRRRSMPIIDAAYSPWLFWDGRKDSLWAQALGPLEDAAEHGGTRTGYVRRLADAYSGRYRALFGPLPDVARLPNEASPSGTTAQRAAWQAMRPAAREAVSRAYSNMGKAIAAYERTLRHGETRFDRYVAAVTRRDPRAAGMLSAQETHGLRVFIGHGQCVTCHNGPLLTDQAFHNTGVPARPGQLPDHGRRAALARLQADEFNCLGPFSDAKPDACGELAFLSKDDPALDGAFKTPGLRGVAQRPPYMHAGQFATLTEAISHYTRAPVAAVGRSELVDRGRRGQGAPIRLSRQDVDDLALFLSILSAEETDAR